MPPTSRGVIDVDAETDESPVSPEVTHSNTKSSPTGRKKVQPKKGKVLTSKIPVEDSQTALPDQRGANENKEANEDNPLLTNATPIHATPNLTGDLPSCDDVGRETGGGVDTPSHPYLTPLSEEPVSKSMSYLEHLELAKLGRKSGSSTSTAMRPTTAEVSDVSNLNPMPNSSEAPITSKGGKSRGRPRKIIVNPPTNPTPVLEFQSHQDTSPTTPFDTLLASARLQTSSSTGRGGGGGSNHTAQSNDVCDAVRATVALKKKPAVRSEKPDSHSAVASSIAPVGDDDDGGQLLRDLIGSHCVRSLEPNAIACARTELEEIEPNKRASSTARPTLKLAESTTTRKAEEKSHVPLRPPQKFSAIENHALPPTTPATPTAASLGSTRQSPASQSTTPIVPFLTNIGLVGYADVLLQRRGKVPHPSNIQNAFHLTSSAHHRLLNEPITTAEALKAAVILLAADELLHSQSLHSSSTGDGEFNSLQSQTNVSHLRAVHLASVINEISTRRTVFLPLGMLALGGQQRGRGRGRGRAFLAGVTPNGGEDVDGDPQSSNNVSEAIEVAIRMVLSGAGTEQHRQQADITSTISSSILRSSPSASMCSVPPAHAKLIAKSLRHVPLLPIVSETMKSSGAQTINTDAATEPSEDSDNAHQISTETAQFVSGFFNTLQNDSRNDEDEAVDVADFSDFFSQNNSPAGEEEERNEEADSDDDATGTLNPRLSFINAAMMSKSNVMPRTSYVATDDETNSAEGINNGFSIGENALGEELGCPSRAEAVAAFYISKYNKVQQNNDREIRALREKFIASIAKAARRFETHAHSLKLRKKEQVKKVLDQYARSEREDHAAVAVMPCFGSLPTVSLLPDPKATILQDNDVQLSSSAPTDERLFLQKLAALGASSGHALWTTSPSSLQISIRCLNKRHSTDSSTHKGVRLTVDEVDEEEEEEELTEDIMRSGDFSSREIFNDFSAVSAASLTTVSSAISNNQMPHTGPVMPKLSDPPPLSWLSIASSVSISKTKSPPKRTLLFVSSSSESIPFSPLQPTADRDIEKEDAEENDNIAEHITEIKESNEQISESIMVSNELEEHPSNIETQFRVIEEDAEAAASSPPDLSPTNLHIFQDKDTLSPPRGENVSLAVEEEKTPNRPSNTFVRSQTSHSPVLRSQHRQPPNAYVRGLELSDSRAPAKSVEQQDVPALSTDQAIVPYPPPASFPATASRSADSSAKAPLLVVSQETKSSQTSSSQTTPSISQAARADDEDADDESENKTDNKGDTYPSALSQSPREGEELFPTITPSQNVILTISSNTSSSACTSRPTLQKEAANNSNRGTPIRWSAFGLDALATAQSGTSGELEAYNSNVLTVGEVEDSYDDYLYTNHSATVENRDESPFSKPPSGLSGRSTAVYAEGRRALHPPPPLRPTTALADDPVDVDESFRNKQPQQSLREVLVKHTNLLAPVPTMGTPSVLHSDRSLLGSTQSRGSPSSELLNASVNRTLDRKGGNEPLSILELMPSADDVDLLSDAELVALCKRFGMRAFPEILPSFGREEAAVTREDQQQIPRASIQAKRRITTVTDSEERSMNDVNQANSGIAKEHIGGVGGVLLPTDGRSLISHLTSLDDYSNTSIATSGGVPYSQISIGSVADSLSRETSQESSVFFDNGAADEEDDDEAAEFLGASPGTPLDKRTSFGSSIIERSGTKKGADEDKYIIVVSSDSEDEEDSNDDSSRGLVATSPSYGLFAGDNPSLMQCKLAPAIAWTYRWQMRQQLKHLVIRSLFTNVVAPFTLSRVSSYGPTQHCIQQQQNKEAEKEEVLEWRSSPSTSTKLSDLSSIVAHSATSANAVSSDSLSMLHPLPTPNIGMNGEGVNNAIASSQSHPQSSPKISTGIPTGRAVTIPNRLSLPNESHSPTSPPTASLTAPVYDHPDRRVYQRTMEVLTRQLRLLPASERTQLKKQIKGEEMAEDMRRVIATAAMDGIRVIEAASRPPHLARCDIRPMFGLNENNVSLSTSEGSMLSREASGLISYEASEQLLSYERLPLEDTYEDDENEEEEEDISQTLGTLLQLSQQQKPQGLAKTISSNAIGGTAANGLYTTSLSGAGAPFRRRRRIEGVSSSVAGNGTVDFRQKLSVFESAVLREAVSPDMLAFILEKERGYATQLHTAIQAATTGTPSASPFENPHSQTIMPSARIEALISGSGLPVAAGQSAVNTAAAIVSAPARPTLLCHNPEAFSIIGKKRQREVHDAMPPFVIRQELSVIDGTSMLLHMGEKQQELLNVQYQRQLANPPREPTNKRPPPPSQRQRNANSYYREGENLLSQQQRLFNGDMSGFDNNTTSQSLVLSQPRQVELGAASSTARKEMNKVNFYRSKWLNRRYGGVSQRGRGRGGN